jgi:transcriptional regulator with XRE-family HTH domain
MEELGTKVREKRGVLGIREAAKQAGIKPTTFARIEAGKMPDLENFKKICEWLAVDPNVILSTKKAPASGLGFSDATGQVFAHLRAKKTMNADTTTHLARLIEAMHKEL